MAGGSRLVAMNGPSPAWRLGGCRFARGVISSAVGACLRLGLGLRGVEALLAERGVVVFRGTIRTWAARFAGQFAALIRRGRLRQNTKRRLERS